MGTRSTRSIATVALGAVLLAACGGSGDDDGAAAGEEATLTVLSFLSEEQFAPVAAAWEQARPEVELDYQSVPFDELNAVIQARAGDGQSDVDVLWVDEPRVASLASQDILLDLDDHLEVPDGALDERAEGAGIFDGGRYSLPLQNSTQFLFYNPELLEAAGVELPGTAPEDRLTWEQLREDAEAAQAAGATWGVVFEQGATPYQVLPLVQSLGGSAGLTGDDLLEPDLVSDAWIEGLEYFGALHEDGVSPRGMGFGETTATFAAGDAAFVLAGPWNLGIFDGQDLPFEYGITPQPVFEGGELVTPAGSFHVGVSASTDAVEAAVDFAEFLSIDPAGNAALTEGDPNIPANTEVLADYLGADTFQRGEGATVAELIEHELTETAVSRPVSVGWVPFEEILGLALEDVRNGQDVRSTLESATDQIEAAFARLQG